MRSGCVLVLVLNALVLVLVLEIGSADRVPVRVPPKAQYGYDKPGFLACHRIEDTGDQREVSDFPTTMNAYEVFRTTIRRFLSNTFVPNTFAISGGDSRRPVHQWLRG